MPARKLPGPVPAAFATAPGKRSRSYVDELAGFAEVFGLELLPWQLEVARQWLEHDAAGALTRHTGTLVVPRRNGKSLLLVVRMLYGMWALGERRVSFSAQDNRTAAEIFGLMVDLVQDHVPEILAGKRLANGQQRLDIRAHDGTVSRFTPTTRTASGGRGLECDLLVMDEGMYLTPSHMAALTPLVAKARHAGRGQVLVASSAGSVESEVLLALRDRGREASGTSPDFAYHEWCAPDDLPADDQRAWAAANPSLGTALLDAAFLSSQRLLNSPEGFAREHLGAWGESGDLPAIDPQAWTLATVPVLSPIYEGVPVWFAFDIAFDRTAAALLCFQQLESGQVECRTLEAISSPEGISERGFRDLIAGHCADLSPESIGYDELSGGHIAKDLATEWPLVKLPVRKYSVACQALKHAVQDGRFIHDGDPLVAQDLARAVPKRFGDGAWIFDRGKAVVPAATAAAIGFYLASDPDNTETVVFTA